MNDFFSERDEFYMRQAIQAAKNAAGRTSPNPMVGAAIVKDGRLIGLGWHRKAGEAHAEIHALNMAGSNAEGATLYVTLEPCSHTGRTGPCAEAIVKAKIARVVAAVQDPNPLVAGAGFNILRRAGIAVTVGVLEDEARKLNEVFFKWVTKKLPFVTLKTAMTLDGKTAAANGSPIKISGCAAHNLVHQWRDANDAIMVGINTVLTDDPSLTARLQDQTGKNPVRIIVDSCAKIPLSAKVLNDNAARTIIAVTENAPEEKLTAIKNKGGEIIKAGDGARTNLPLLLQKIAAQNICSVLVEGGGTLNFALLREKLADKIHIFIAPKILGGEKAPSPVAGEGFATLDNGVKLKDKTVRECGDDILITGYAEYLFR